MRLGSEETEGNKRAPLSPLAYSCASSVIDVVDGITTVTRNAKFLWYGHAKALSPQDSVIWRRER